MGDLATFKANEERALALVAEKFKAWGITPNNDTVKLHQEFSATSCPHRSVEIHGGFDATKAYFIRRISELMNSTDKWIQDAKGWWYRYADGSYPKNQWLKLAGEWYYFDSYGYAAQNEWKCLKGLWYYFNDKCKMVRGFLKDGDYWYFLNRKAGSKREGAMLTEFVWMVQSGISSDVRMMDILLVLWLQDCLMMEITNITAGQKKRGGNMQRVRWSLISNGGFRKSVVLLQQG